MRTWHYTLYTTNRCNGRLYFRPCRLPKKNAIYKTGANYLSTFLGGYSKIHERHLPVHLYVCIFCHVVLHYSINMKNSTLVSKYFWPNFGIQLLPIVQVRGLNYFTVSEAISLKESRWTYKLQTIIFFAIIRDSEINLGSR